MEIEIPDLDDVKFEELCGCCRGAMVTTTYENLPRERDKNGRLRPIEYKKVTTPCPVNHDSDGMVPTIVGERLLDFLARRGIK